MSDEMKKYLRCRKCDLWKTRRSVVLGRGNIPAEVLFIGEAPGKSEDLVGKAFIGPAGRILQSAIEQVLLKLKKPNLTYYITNTVACRPTDKKFGANRQPTKEEMLACWPRVQLVERLVKPKHIILLGKVSEQHCSAHFPSARALLHPAYILRRGGKESAEYRTFVRELTEILRPQRRRSVFDKRRK